MTNKHIWLPFIFIFSFIVYVIIQLAPYSQGQLLLPKISGLYYQTSSGHKGYTNAGKFAYSDNDTITFYIGNEHTHLKLGTSIAQPIITLTQLSSSSLKSNNLLRVLAALDFNKSDMSEIRIKPESINTKFLEKLIKTVDWQREDLTIQDIELPSIDKAASYMTGEFNHPSEDISDIVLSPLDKKYRELSVKLRDNNGNQCFYDLSNHHGSDNSEPYFGPMGALTYKVTNTGILTYPDIGDHFGSWDNKFSSCELNTQFSTKVEQFEAIEEFVGFKGIIGCARQGCTMGDLTGFAVDKYQTKYRTVAYNFNPKTGVLVKKSKGLGKADNIKYPNYAEFLTFSYDLSYEQNIDFEGIWLESDFSSKEAVTARCLLFTNGKVFTQERPSANCSTKQTSYSVEVTNDYPDMWWHSEDSSKASLAQLNTPVKWQNTLNAMQFTIWEYLPTGSSWASGILQRLTYKKVDTSQTIESAKVFEYRKLH